MKTAEPKTVEPKTVEPKTVAAEIEGRLAFWRGVEVVE